MTKLKEIKRPDSIPKKSYTGGMSLMGIKGGLSFAPVTCKEEVYHSLGKALGVAYDTDSMEYIMGPDVFDDEIDVKNPGIIFYLDARNKFTGARRINKVVGLLHKKHRLRTKPSVALYEDGSVVLIRVATWYYKNPISISGLLTVIRVAAISDFSFETIDEFLDKAIDTSYLGADSTHLSAAQRSGNLKGFLDKSLPIIKYRGNAWKWGRHSDIAWDGIVDYDSSEKDYIDISGGLSYSEEDYEDDGEYCCYDCDGY